MKKLLLAVDYDNTFVEAVWPEAGTLKRGARRWFHWAKRRGHTLVLWTCRDSMDLNNAISYLKREGIHFDLINANDPERMRIFGNDTRKVGADWYFDDKSGFKWWWTAYFTVWKLERRSR